MVYDLVSIRRRKFKSIPMSACQLRRNHLELDGIEGEWKESY
jgi:hypothetical protein